MSSIVVAGDTSGTVTLQAPAVAGTTTLTLPATSGTVLAPSGGTLTVAQGGTGLTSVGTSGQFLQSNGTDLAYAAVSGTLLNIRYFTSGATTYTPTAGTNFVIVELIGGGAGSAIGTVSYGGAGGTSSFGALVSATGGAVASASGSAGGTGSGGDLNLTGGRGVSVQATTTSGGAFIFGAKPAMFGQSDPSGFPTTGTGITSSTYSSLAPVNYGQSSGGVANASSRVSCGGAGGYARKKINSAFSGVTITVGAGGTAGTSGTAGTGGIVIVYEYA